MIPALGSIQRLGALGGHGDRALVGRWKSDSAGPVGRGEGGRSKPDAEARSQTSLRDSDTGNESPSPEKDAVPEIGVWE